jgi:RNA polymerase sigma-54 factor
MLLEPGINLEQTQRPVLTPELRQAIAILQLGTTELVQYVENEMLENPLLEQNDDDPGESTLEEGDSQIDWITYLAENEQPDSHYAEQAPVNREEPERATWDNYVAAVPTLSEHLDLQLHLALSDPRQIIIGEFLIGNIDEHGYLQGDLDEVCQACKCSLEEAEEVLRVVQSFDPSGVGGRSLAECLLVQLEQRGLRDPVMEQLVNRHLDDLAAAKYARIAKGMGITEQEIRTRVDVIRSLDPKPGRNFSHPGETRYIVPDAVVEKVDDEYIILVNDSMVPRLMINNTYRELIRQRDICDPDAIQFIETKLKAALWLIRGIEQRRDTLQRVLRLILQFQKDFFDKGNAHLKGLTLRQVAEVAGLHESTVSRATANKYVQTPRGLFDMKFFFRRGVENEFTGEIVASDVVKRILKELVAVEDAGHPYSDQDICRLIDARGLHIARRTVAKYRQELNILPARQRRRCPGVGD